MSDIIVTFDGPTAPAKACLDAPPAHSQAVDSCNLTVPLVDEANPTAASRPVRFDRRGDQFFLSEHNPLDLRMWVRQQSELVLPALEGVVCALGAIGLGLTEGLTAVKQDSSLHLGLGTTAAGLLGAGCGALGAHFILPLFAKNRVRNRYAWEGGAAAAGAALSISFYLLGNLMGSRSGSPAKYPTDPYGP